MASTLSELRHAYDRALAYVEDVRASGQAAEHVSKFWGEILAGRANYPSFDELLLMRRGFTYPLAERRRSDDAAAEAEYASAAHFVASSSVPGQFLAELEEPAFGCPLSFDFGGKQLSANCLVNAITVHGVLEACRRAGIAGRTLRVLEIGAGFGQAARLLLERLDVEVYAVCDLPENLFLSAFYLQALHPDRVPAFGGGDGALVFVAPPHAGELRVPFDLVLNSYSFQEMTQASVDRYFALAVETLAPDGVFYSLNAHGKDDVEWPSDYPLRDFRLDRLRAPRRFPFQWNATVPYELVLRPGGRGVALPDLWLDGIGCAYQLGLGEELDELCDRLARGTLGAQEEAWLEQLGRLFRGESSGEKRRAADALRDMDTLPAVGAYVAGCLAYAEGSTADATSLLACAEPGLGSSLARVHAGTLLGKPAARELAPHLAEELAATRAATYAAHLAACLHLADADRRLRARGRLGRRWAGVGPD